MKNIEDIIMTGDRLMGPTFFIILNEMWTDFLRFGNAGGGGGGGGCKQNKIK